MTTSAVEDYLKRIYLEMEERTRGQRTETLSGGGTRPLLRTGALARAAGVTPGTATAMVRAMAADGLVYYQPYAGVRLTRKGRREALAVTRRHRLVERLLVDVLHMDWADVHEEAELLEHAVSDRVLEVIDEYLGHPTADPHGDPIPSADGRVEEPSWATLDDCVCGQSLRASRITDQSPGFLREMAGHGIRPGAMLTVLFRDESAGTIEIRLGRRRITLAASVAGRIRVELGQASGGSCRISI